MQGFVWGRCRDGWLNPAGCGHGKDDSESAGRTVSNKIDETDKPLETNKTLEIKTTHVINKTQCGESGVTSEVVLMNNKAVAVAADSVVTVAVDGVPRKTYNGVNKLFEISPGNPVAMMIYSNAEVMGYPWKTVINAYKSQSKNPAFDSIEGYAEDFFRFLDGNKQLFSDQLQHEQYALMLNSLIATIEYRAQQLKSFLVANGHGPEVTESKSLVAMAIGQIYDRVTLDDYDEPRQRLACFPDDFEKTMDQLYGGLIKDVLGNFLGKHDLDERSLSKLRDLPYLMITNHYFPESWPYSGIVFAGYGAGQIHPQVCSYEVSNVVGNIVKRGDHIFAQLSNEMPVIIQPFAQDRMIRTLLYGIDPYLESLIISKTFELVPRLMDQIVGNIPDLTDDQMEKFVESLQEEDFGEAVSDFFGSIFHHQAMHHMVPIYSAIQALPEHDLARTAEALVNLNSFQQQVSLEVETVGGAIDCALLTPTEGFVWYNEPKSMTYTKTES